MNERIKELWTQGTFNVVPRTGDYSSVSAEQIEKFAELIIKECITISEAHAKSLEAQPCDQEFEQYEDGIVSGIYEATAVIKEHFGVEE